MRSRVPAWILCLAIGFSFSLLSAIGGSAALADTPSSLPVISSATLLAAGSAPEGSEDAHGHDDHAAADAYGDAHGKEEPSLFASEPWPYVWNLLMFLVLLVVLTKFVWPGILKGLQDRENKIAGDLASAEKARVDAETKFAEYEAKLAEARGEAGRIVDEARVAAEQVAAKIKAESERELSQMRERATNEIESAKTQAVSDIYSQAATLSTQLASQILGREINADDQRELIDRSLSELGSTLGSDGTSNN